MNTDKNQGRGSYSTLRTYSTREEVPKSHRYQVCAKARDRIVALLAASQANSQEFTAKAA